jgi:ribosome-associated toxin RatA of RatAB toxin-antitoxin module
MDVIHRELLLRHREALVSDVLQPESLLPYLLSQKILTHEDSNLIQAQVSTQFNHQVLSGYKVDHQKKKYTNSINNRQ